MWVYVTFHRVLDKKSHLMKQQDDWIAGETDDENDAGSD